METPPVEPTGDAAEPVVNGHEHNGQQNGQPVNQDRKPPIYKVGPIPTGVNESVEACVWSRQAQYDNRTVTLYSVTLQVSYRDGEEWKRSSSLKYQQLPIAIYVLQKAFDHISALRDKSMPNF